MALKAKKSFTDYDIEQRSIKVAKKYGLDVERVKAMYSKLIKVLGENLNLVGLELAFMYNEPSTALTLLEKEDIVEFAKRVNLVRYFFLDFTPRYTLEMLIDLVQDYVSYLNRNHYYLIEIGYPKREFEGSGWINSLLSFLYPIKRGRIFAMNDESPDVWYSSPGRTQEKPQKYDPELYDKESIFEFLTQEEATRLKAGRSKLFDLKISILNELLKAIRVKNANKLWDNCLRLITEAIPAQEADFYLSIDRRYTRQYAEFDIGAGERHFGLPSTGGLSSLFEIIGHCWKEIEIGTMAKTIPTLIALIECMEDEWQFRWEDIMTWDKLNYYQFLGIPERKIMDDLLDFYLNLEKQEENFWVKYRNLVNEALESEFYDEVIIRTKVKRKLVNKFEPQVKSFSEWMKTHLEATGSLPELHLSQVSDQKDEIGNVFRKEGESWRIKYEGKGVYINDSKGMRYLAMLLKNPKQEFSAVQLYQEIETSQPSNTKKIQEGRFFEDELTISNLGDTEEVIDNRALTECKHRIKELKSEIEEAKENFDSHRAEELEEEKEQLENYLLAAMGIGGKARRFDNPAERARKAVTNQIKKSIKKIHNHHPTFGTYLKNSIKTGRFCSYSPEKPTSWEI